MTYSVRYDDEAVEDIQRSYEWGVEHWGSEAAHKWLRDLFLKVRKSLETAPRGYPIAPESMDVDRELRHIIWGRYRVIFTFEGNDVVVVHLRGSYTGK